MRTPIPIRRPGSGDLNNSQKRRLWRGVVFPIFLFAMAVGVLVAAVYLTAAQVDTPPDQKAAPISDSK